MNICIKISSANGFTNIVKLLLTRPEVDPTDDHNSAIRFAVKYGYIEIVQLLLECPNINPPIINMKLSKLLL